LLDTFRERGSEIILEDNNPVIDRVCPYRRTKDWQVDQSITEKMEICNNEVYIMGTIIVIANDIKNLSQALDRLNSFSNINRFKIIIIYNKIKYRELKDLCDEKIKNDYKCLLYFNELNLQIYRSLEFAKNGFLFIVDSNKEIRDDLIDKVNNLVNKKLFRVLHISNKGDLHESVNMIHIYKYIKGDLGIPIYDKLLDIEKEEQAVNSQVFDWKEVDEQYSN
jgi:hypothetical protein